MKLDPITLAVMNNRLAAIADEMGVVLGQTARGGKWPKQGGGGERRQDRNGLR